MATAKATHISRQRRPSSHATCAKLMSLYSFSSSGAPTMIVDPAADLAPGDASPAASRGTLSRSSGDGAAAASVAGTVAGGAAVLLAMCPLLCGSAGESGRSVVCKQLRSSARRELTCLQIRGDMPRGQKFPRRGRTASSGWPASLPGDVSKITTHKVNNTGGTLRDAPAHGLR